jgi:dienelactone hydrolase
MESDSESYPTPYLLFSDQLYNKLEGWNEEDYAAVQNVETNSFVETPIKDDLSEAPVLIFSPSLGGNLSYYTYYAEYFAQRGYIVMGINHLYESEAIVHDGTIYLGNLQFHDSLKTLEIPEEISAEQYRETKGIRQKVLGQDIQFALNQLLTDSSFGSKIDTGKVGVFGHSIGGAAAIYSSLLDDRINVVIDLDGTPPTVALNKGIDVPFLFLEDLTDYENHQGYAKLHKRRNDFCNLNRADSWRVLIEGFNHNSFLDINYYLAEDANEIESEKEKLDMILGYMNAFLEHYLLGGNNFHPEINESEKTEVFKFTK